MVLRSVVFFVLASGAVTGVGTPEAHQNHLRQLFERLKQYGILINTSKCNFRQSSVKFLGYQVSAASTRPLETKVEAIQNLPAPKTVKELQRFLVEASNIYGVCGPNQELRCVKDCPPERTCRNRGIIYNCLADCQCCRFKCVCKEGYYRNYLGDCITGHQCDLCRGKNEFFACNSACNNECATIATQNRTNCPIKNIVCTPRCYCDDGYAEDAAGNCIPVDQCPCTPVCSENEVLDDCPSNSPSDYCPKSEHDNYRAPKPNPCPPPACKCKFNYRRAANGTCIPTTDCPPFPCKRPNEKYTPCPPICPTDACSIPRVTGICPYNIGIILECNPKCQCKDGYGRFNGVCVPFKDCPNLCPVNEEYSSCTQAVCRQQTCANRHKPEVCVYMDKELCQKGCVCKKNYYRNKNGTCVTAEHCEASS